MSTVIGFTCADGAVVAADRALVRGGKVVSTGRQRVFALDGVAVGVAGDDPETVRRELDGELRSYRTERGRDPGVTATARLAAEVTEATGSDLVLLARDDDGAAQLRAVYADGGVLDDSPVALGTGAQLALGRLEGADTDVSTGAAASLAREVLAGVAERDAATGEECDVETLTDD